MRKYILCAFFIVLAMLAASCASSKKGVKSDMGEEKKAAGQEMKGTSKENDIPLDELQKDAEAAMKAARQIKADVAMKEEFEQALAVYQDALTQKDQGKKKRAGDLFIKAKSNFETLYAKTDAKRQRAQQAIQDSKRELKMIEQKAKAAGLS